MDERFSKTFFRVEATGFERLTLWGQRRRDWVQHSAGCMVTVGQFHGYPVNISCFWDEIDGKLVLFWEAVSRVIDIELIEQWLDRNCTGGSCNAMNFHNCIIAINDATAQRAETNT